ncbi:MAG: hypothetical protein V1870_03815 [Candidatus Aenigmatarchaeota archaeon]
MVKTTKICDRYHGDVLAIVTYYCGVPNSCSASEYCFVKDSSGCPVGLGAIISPVVVAKEAKLFTKLEY